MYLLYENEFLMLQSIGKMNSNLPAFAGRIFFAFFSATTPTGVQWDIKREISSAENTRNCPFRSGDQNGSNCPLPVEGVKFFGKQ